LNGTLAQDLNFTIRSMKNRPGFHSLILLVFALGIGANTIIFSVVDGVMLRPLPYPDPDRLVVPWQTDPSLRNSPNPTERAIAEGAELSFPIYRDWLELNTVFEALGVYQHPERFYASDGDRIERVRGTRVTHGVFTALGVPPLVGRTLNPDDDEFDGPRLAVLSHGWWQARFGSDSTAVGRAVVLDGEVYTIVGVMPRRFRFPGDPQVFLAVSQPDHPMFDDRDANVLVPIARLRPGVTLNRAQREMEVLAEHLKEVKPIPGKDRGVNVVYLHDDIVGRARPQLIFLLGAVGVFLVIACANIANLLLVRASERRKEMALRMSLGAGLGRILRQLVTEGLTLSLMGGLLGSCAAFVLLDPFLSILPSDTPRLSEIGLNHRIVVFSTVITVLTGAIVAILPAFKTFGTRMATVLQDTDRRTLGSRKENRMQAGLVVSQVALAFVFLFAAGLFIRSFDHLTSVDRGFEAEGVVVLEVDMGGYRYAAEAQPRVAYDELVQRLEAIPGVVSVGKTETSPFNWTMSRDLTVETREGPKQTSTHFDRVSPSYFEVMGIPLLAGRAFSEEESFTSDAVVIVNDALAQAYWPTESAIGKRIQDTSSPWLTIVGVVGDTRHRLERDPFFTVYYPAPAWYPTLLLKTAIHPSLVMNEVRTAVGEVDPTMSIASLRELEQTISATVAGPRVRTVLLSALAALAATLAVVGVFSVLAYAVARRTREIGIRVALGAEAGEVMRSVLRRSLFHLGVGLAIGLVISLGALSTLEGFLFQVEVIDPTSLFSAILLLTVATLSASFFPARRAATVDPVEALRRE
jgi:predicted permease